MNFFAKLANWFEWILLQSFPTFLNEYFCKVANCFNEYFCKVGQLAWMNIFAKLAKCFEWIFLLSGQLFRMNIFAKLPTVSMNILQNWPTGLNEYFCEVGQLFWMNILQSGQLSILNEYFCKLFQWIFLQNWPTGLSEYLCKVGQLFWMNIFAKWPTVLNEYRIFAKLANCMEWIFCKVRQLFWMNILISWSTVLNEFVWIVGHYFRINIFKFSCFQWIVLQS